MRGESTAIHLKSKNKQITRQFYAIDIKQREIMSILHRKIISKKCKFGKKKKLITELGAPRVHWLMWKSTFYIQNAYGKTFFMHSKKFDCEMI